MTETDVRAPKSAVFDGLTPPYRTLVVDPPWRYATKGITTTAKSERTRPDSSAQYSTMSPFLLLGLTEVVVDDLDRWRIRWIRRAGDGR